MFCFFFKAESCGIAQASLKLRILLSCLLSAGVTGGPTTPGTLGVLIGIVGSVGQGSGSGHGLLSLYHGELSTIKVARLQIEYSGHYYKENIELLLSIQFSPRSTQFYFLAIH